MAEKVNIVLDASKIDIFETCPARYDFRHNKNKILPIAFKSKGLDLGGLAHEGFAVYYSMLAEGIQYNQRLEACINKINEISANPDQSNSDAEDVNNLTFCIEQNLDYWRAEDENWLTVLAVEQPFAYILYEDDDVRIIISGKIDLLADYTDIAHKTTYKRAPFDHKTFSRDGEVLRKSNQFINYAAAVESVYLFVNRVGLTKAEPGEKFKRLPLGYDPIYMADWKKNLTKMLLNEYLTCVATRDWPEKPTSCNKFNRLCEYYQICDSSGQDSKDYKLAEFYVDAPEWDVTKNLTTEEK